MPENYASEPLLEYSNSDISLIKTLRGVQHIMEHLIFCIEVAVKFDGRNNSDILIILHIPHMFHEWAM